MNVADILKLVAKIFGILGTIGSIILGISGLGYNDAGIVILMAIACLLSVGLFYLLLYAAGEVVEKLYDIDHHVSQVVNNSYEIFKKMNNTQD